jgi:hypothetical protein
MRFALVAHGIVLFLFVDAGCSSKKKPGATYNVTILARGNDGKPALQGPSQQVEGAGVESRKDITHEGQTISLLVRKTQYGRATFDVTFPDKTTQMVQVKVRPTQRHLAQGTENRRAHRDSGVALTK